VLVKRLCHLTANTATLCAYTSQRGPLKHRQPLQHAAATLITPAPDDEHVDSIRNVRHQLHVYTDDRFRALVFDLGYAKTS
jgi:hypothetical protein